MITLMIIFGFGLTIFVHELGHFLMARRMGVRVEVFSIGFGPRLLTFAIDKQGTQWILSLLPLGGYVKMVGQEDMPGGGVDQTPPPDSYQAKKPWQRLLIVTAGVIMNAIFAYFLLVAAFTVGVPFPGNVVGGVMPGYPGEKAGFKQGDEILRAGGRGVETWEDFLVMAFLLDNEEPLRVDIIREGTPMSLSMQIPSIGGADDKSPLPDLGLFPRQVAIISRVNDKETLSKMGLESGEHILKFAIQGGNVYQTPSGIDRTVALHPGAECLLTVRNPKSGEIREVALTIPTQQVVDPGFKIKAVVEPVQGGPAKESGIEAGDMVLKMDDTPIQGWSDIHNFCLEIGSEAPVSILVNRRGEKKQFSLTPRYNLMEERYLIGVQLFRSDGEGKQIGRLSYVAPWLKKAFKGPREDDMLVRYGLNREDSFLNRLGGNSDKEIGKESYYAYHYRRDDIDKKCVISSASMEKLERGDFLKFSNDEKLIRYSFFTSMYKSIYRGYRELEEIYLSVLNLIQGDISLKLIGGPIRIFQVSHLVAEVRGWGYFILLFAKIGFSLAFFNILPIPILDGGHAAFIIYEMIRGRPAPPRFISLIHYIGFILMITLFLFVFYNDLHFLFLGF